ncbi:GH25 family lysozyme M1 (1,4-beta-N-acetylmuramidase) [Clostridium saccharoperbutylacetonicum]|uniref:Glycoside hydrolase, family 25 n=1 Tax=Clostridium saccharoperbutylacetonicum N1-4(HMT) TaxID=931276 RepID=M1MKV5_9CLOT|nr:GH25 family lysozyme [Clostridium saccharoperbutylacetonicum]AGF56903.1 glycoside hydrolase, family 25 [Clostridium saccharoperbutylacetonicum N1-4(HMT)]NRT62338.1 GH25 family lysozyme M1 (1,4-beta-N-acetylmuramidase) [Clostridium saccharoperbutylacetonicum]NSB25675.1 GH25 family lysozyme M1 (1,4-beta-N-acetylmuramidase) [Clostridium saccharoperbutylacetonicum]NSB45041.1 GH25 family lysozyme M1 (1,4-beta-N-acetylmuramidase) [Clostridium saccharoperbutylacetonicum]
MKGLDVSNLNGNINFNQVKVDCVEVVYIKATEGTTYTDSYLETNYSNAHYAGLKTGFYHFLAVTNSPETQATSFYNATKNKTNDLIPMLDIEIKFDGLMDYVIRFINKFKELSNFPIGVYTYTGFMDNIYNRIANYPLWEANYNDDPWNLPSNSIWSARAGHQYTESGQVSGINTKCDINDGILIKTTGYVRTDYLPNGYRGDGSFEGVDLEYVLSYFKGFRCYVRSDSKGIWLETQILPIEKC